MAPHQKWKKPKRTIAKMNRFFSMEKAISENGCQARLLACQIE